MPTPPVLHRCRLVVAEPENTPIEFQASAGAALVSRLPAAGSALRVARAPRSLAQGRYQASSSVFRAKGNDIARGCRPFAFQTLGRQPSLNLPRLFCRAT